MASKAKAWGIDRRISITNLVQIGVILIACVTFYNTVQNNQSKNEDRFTTFTEQRKIQDQQMVEMQKGQTQVLLQLSTITERQNYLTDTVKDLNESIKSKSLR